MVNWGLGIIALLAFSICQDCQQNERVKEQLNDWQIFILNTILWRKAWSLDKCSTLCQSHFTYAGISEHLGSKKEKVLLVYLNFPDSFSFPPTIILSGINFPGPCLEYFPSYSNVLIHRLALSLEIKDPCDLIPPYDIIFVTISPIMEKIHPAFLN